MKTTIGMTTKRRLVAVVAAGALAAGSATVLAATHTGSTPATSTASATAATPGPGTAPGPGGAGPGGSPGGAGPGSDLTVTGVSARTITARDSSGHTITVRVGATTTYSEAGARAALSAIKVGEHIAVQAAGATTLNATRVTIMLPQVMGRITAVDGASLTIQGVNGATVTVKTTTATRYVKASGATTAASALKKGVAIMAEGTLSGNGKTLTARRITVGVAATGPGSGPGGGTPPGGPGGAPPPSGTAVPGA